MRITKYLLHFVTVLGIVLALPIINSLVIPKHAQAPAVSRGGSLTLQPPAFFNAAYAQETEQPVCTPDLLSNAGLMAYIDLQTEVDVTAIASFDAIEEETDQYIIGSFLPSGFEAVPEYDEAAYVQVLVCNDGWIVAYLPKDQLAGALIDWVSYDQRKLKKTSLDDGIEKVVSELGLRIPTAPGAIAYYDTRFPDATGIKLVADSISVTDEGNPFSEDFQITIPKKLTIYELSSTHSVLDLVYLDYLITSECKLDENIFSTLTAQGAGTRLYSIKAFDESESMSGKTHTVTVTQRRAGSSYCGVAIVYGETAQ